MQLMIPGERPWQHRRSSEEWSVQPTQRLPMMTCPLTYAQSILTGWDKKTAHPTGSQQIVLQCVPIKLVVSDLTRVVSHIHKLQCFILVLNILSVKYSTHGVILDAKLRYWYKTTSSKDNKILILNLRTEKNRKSGMVRKCWRNLVWNSGHCRGLDINILCSRDRSPAAH